MKPLHLKIYPTRELVCVGDTVCRVWSAVTAGGPSVRVPVAAVAVREGRDDAELRRELSRIPSPPAPGQELT